MPVERESDVLLLAAAALLRVACQRRPITVSGSPQTKGSPPGAELLLLETQSHCWPVRGEERFFLCV
jgi:hypothetical protein